MMKANAEIITIGNEILSGQTLDTNAHWLSQILDSIGVDIKRRFTISDQEGAIFEALALCTADIILITGGLGPTHDDITKTCLSSYFSTQLVYHPEVLEHIKKTVPTIDGNMRVLYEEQAHLPKNCEVVPNSLGTAPGMWFEYEKKIWVAMPGVPHEMKQMMTDGVIPKLVKKLGQQFIYHKTIRTVGIREVQLYQLIENWVVNISKSAKIAFLPMLQTVKIRLTFKGTCMDELKKRASEAIDQVLPMIQPYVYGFDEEELEEMIGNLLLASNLTLATAESCTGGYLSHQITSVSNSSKWYKGGVIPYDNLLKCKLLEVDDTMILKYGAVSEPVVVAMAKNTRKLLNSDVAISISGIMGPSGGKEDKPVGTVWIGYADAFQTIAEKFYLKKNRLKNIQSTSIIALNIIRKQLKKRL